MCPVTHVCAAAAPAPPGENKTNKNKKSEKKIKIHGKNGVFYKLNHGFEKRTCAK